tara:strand:- start:702 stop:1358 length:657 start_codon:yes stop_codon:yes gene_type:complete
MKKYIIILISLFILTGAQAQNINWNHNTYGNHFISLGASYDYGAIVYASYYKSLNKLPFLLGGEISMPMGHELMDDFKVKLGGQYLFVDGEYIKVAGTAKGIIRRYENDYVRSWGFGAEFGVMAGYYRDKWHVGYEINFDKSVTTHLKHTDKMKEVYPDIQDGWILPAGGNWEFGVYAGCNLGKNLTLSFRSGATNAQKKDEDALLPIYTKIEFIHRF